MPELLVESPRTGRPPAAGRPASRADAGESRCRVAVIWIDWYAYHLARFAGLAGHPDLAGRVAGIELVGGIGVHAGLRFREELPAGLPIETLFPRTNWADAAQLRVARALWRKLDALDPEVVLVPGYYTLPALAAALWARVHRRKSVLMTESTEQDHPRSRARERAKSWLIRSLFNWAVAGGAPHRRYLDRLGFRPEQVAGFYDVVDNAGLLRQVSLLRQEPAARPPYAPYVPYFLYVGRLAEEKNLGGLIEAYLAYREQGGGWPLVLVGEGPERGRLEQRAAASPAAGEILFAGHRGSGELPAYYAFAGCFVLASTREPWGLVVNEAMACGLPVIVSTRCGCAEDLVAPGGGRAGSGGAAGPANGFVFDPAQPGELVAALTSVERMSADERARMGQASLERIAAYGPEQFGEQIAWIANAGP